VSSGWPRHPVLSAGLYLVAQGSGSRIASIMVVGWLSGMMTSGTVTQVPNQRQLIGTLLGVSSMEDLNRIIVGASAQLNRESSIMTGPQSRRLLPPRLVSTLYGRAVQFTEVRDALAHGEPVVLHGMAGMGKSALASSIAWSLVDDYPNGVLWIDCGYSPLDAICDHIGIQFEDDQMLKLDTIAKPARVRYLFGAYRVLVVLDNVWEADVARSFAQKCVPAGYSLVVTSREKIARVGRLIEIDSLAHEAGTALFRDVAELPAGQEIAESVQLVRLLGGHPQGLTIAGALCLEDALSVRELIQMLGKAEERARRLSLGEDASNNVWATFELSYQRLSPEEQVVFRAFGGSWSKSSTAEMLSSIVQADEDSVAQILRGLVKRALARVEIVFGEHRKYVIHDLIFAFAKGLLREQEGSLEDAYARWLHAAINYASKYQEDSPENHNALDVELENLLGAAGWAAERGRHSDLNRLAHVLSDGSFLSRRGYNKQAVGLLHKAIVAAQALGDRQSECTHLLNLGYSYALLSLYSDALAQYGYCLELATDLEDRTTQGKCSGLMGFVHDNVGDYPNAIKYYENAYQITRSLNDKVGQGQWLGSMAGTYRTIGDTEQAVRLYTQAIALARRIGDRTNECVHLSNLGNAHRSWGEHQTALDNYEQALTLARDIGDRATEARALVNAGRVLARIGRATEGLDKCRAALELFTEIGFESGVGYAHGYLGEVLRSLGHPEQAYEETLLALKIHKGLAVLNGQADWLHNLGMWKLQDGEYDQGVAHLRQAYDIRHEIGASAKAEATAAILAEAGVSVELTQSKPAEPSIGQTE